MTCQKPFPTCRSGASRGKRGEILLLFHGDSMGIFPLRKGIDPLFHGFHSPYYYY